MLKYQFYLLLLFSPRLLSAQNFGSRNLDSTKGEERKNGVITNQKISDSLSIFKASRPNTLLFEDLKINGKPNRKLILSYIKELKSKNAQLPKPFKAKAYGTLAKLFARLKLYPLVMKCFLNANIANNTITECIIDDNQLDEDETSIKDTSILHSIKPLNKESLKDGTPLAIAENDSLNIKTDSIYLNHSGTEIVSKPIVGAEVLNPFNDGKKGIKYAMIVHIQQPEPGRRTIFIQLHKVGHTFITLIKYNADSTYVSKTFGFYPQKDHFLSATPIFPSSTGIFKNDEMHDWDEVIGKFISHRRFEKILKVIQQYNSQRYDINKCNCTDFGLQVAAIGGLKILNAYGTWPLGGGNNPGCAGQSLLEGKVQDTDSNNLEGFFIFNDLLQSK